VSRLPTLPMTGERELDRIVTALNDAGQRLALERQRADELPRRLATGERLAAIGRLTAGVAHEFRNPIAAMRLKAEGAISGDVARKDRALKSVLGQVDRLDDLLRRLLSVTARDETRRVSVKLAPFLKACAAAHRELASAKGVALESRTDVDVWTFDPEQTLGIHRQFLYAKMKRYGLDVSAERTEGVVEADALSPPERE
jgi:signal transduction histidine kinase